MNELFNELEKAFLNAHLGMPETVNYFQELRDSILLFLMPYHPEIEGLFQVSNGSSMTFIFWGINGEQMIPVFTSYQRVEEALKATGRWHEKNGVAEVLGKELLHLITMIPNDCKVIVNPGWEKGSRIMDAKMIKSVVDGSALYISSPGEIAMSGLVISLPAHQPVQLRDPLNKFFSSLPEVKAAWLFYEEEPKKPHEQVYVLGLMLEGGNAAEIKSEAALAIAGACPPEWASRAIIMDAADPGFNDIMHGVLPFYKTNDFQPPAKLPPDPADLVKPT